MNQPIGLLPRKLLLSKILLCALAFSLCFRPAFAAPTVRIPAVSFSPKVIDFGIVPFGTVCKQLVTVTFDRHVFSPDHLPILRPNRYSYAIDVSLFARFNGPDTIQTVYLVTVDSYFCIGSFCNGLVLVDNEKMPALDLDPLNAQKADVVVTGRSVQGLTAPDQLDFGSIEVGQSKTKLLDAGFHAPPMAHKSYSMDDPGADLFVHTLGLKDTSAVSSSPDVTVSCLRELGMSASVWQTWSVTFKARLPLGKNRVELRFQTEDGYCATVLAVAEIVPRSKPEPHTRTKH